MARKQQRQDNALSMPTSLFHPKTEMHSLKKLGQTVAISLQKAMDHNQPQSTEKLLPGTLHLKTAHAPYCCIRHKTFPLWEGT